MSFLKTTITRLTYVPIILGIVLIQGSWRGRELDASGDPTFAISLIVAGIAARAGLWYMDRKGINSDNTEDLLP